MQIEKQKVKNMEEENVETNYPQLKPFNCVGDFIFGDNIDKYKNHFKYFKLQPKDEFIDDYHKSLYGNMEITVENNRISSITCHKKLFYESINLIGLELDKFMRIMKYNHFEEEDKLNIYENNIPIYVYEFSDIGCQVWVENNKIVTIIANGIDAYSDESYFQ